MAHTDPHYRTPGLASNASVRVHVLVPYAGDSSPDYDTPAFRAEAAGWFADLEREWLWCPVTIETAETAVAAVAADGGIALNLCDGDELDGFPGLAVTGALERAGVPFTGADSAFYATSSSKRAMKDRLLAAGVPVPARVSLDDEPAPADFPAIVKLDSGADGKGLTRDAVARSRAELRAAVTRMRGAAPDRAALDLYAERFVDGPEYTALVVGRDVYPVLVVRFLPSLPPEERILFHHHQEIPHCGWEVADAEQQDALRSLALRAFAAVGGCGYGRVDMRRDGAAGEVRVLEVNANCALSADEPTVAVAVAATGRPFHALIGEILAGARCPIPAAA